MTKNERILLNRLMDVCNKLGGAVDRTAVSERKLFDHQQAHMQVSNVLYGMLTQHPDNEYSEEDMKKALINLEYLEELVNVEYPDRNGNY